MRDVFSFSFPLDLIELDKQEERLKSTFDTLVGH